jgi:hypothetical protein
MQIHAGPTGKADKSKTEMTYFAAPYSTYITVDLSTTPPTFISECGEVVDFSDIAIDADRAVPITFKFKYLGSMLHHTTSDESDVNARVAQASGAYGALSDCLFSSPDVTPEAKGEAYKTLVLGILLYGSESWALTQKSWSKLRAFHNQCVRRMCRTTTHQQWKSHIRNSTLRCRLRVEEIEVYVYRRQLAWLGDISRMPMDRMPRVLLSAWVAADRPAGGQKYSYAKGMLAALTFAGIATDTRTVSENWPALAADKASWNAMCDNLGLYHSRLSPEARGAALAPSSPLRAAAAECLPNGHHSSCLCHACCQRQQRQAAQPLTPAQQQRQQQQQTPPQPPPAEEVNNSDGDSSSADDGRPQYFIRNSDSSATSGDDSSDDSSFDSSGAGAESAGDSPQGKSDVVQSRQDGGFYPTRGRVAQNERDRERDEETERGV